MEDRLEFESVREFKEYMENNETTFTDKVVSKIEEGLLKGRASVDLFTLALEDSEELLLTSLEKSEWKNALENSLEFYTRVEEADKAIDTWKVLQKLSKE